MCSAHSSGDHPGCYPGFTDTQAYFVCISHRSHAATRRTMANMVYASGPQAADPREGSHRLAPPLERIERKRGRPHRCDGDGHLRKIHRPRLRETSSQRVLQPGRQLRELRLRHRRLPSFSRAARVNRARARTAASLRRRRPPAQNSSTPAP